MAKLLVKAWKGYNAVLISKPILAPAVSTGVLMGAGDLLAQSVEASQQAAKAKGTEGVNWRRTARLFTLGCCLYGPWLNQWYKFLATRFQGQRLALVKMVSADQLVMAPCVIGSYLTVVTYLNTADATKVSQQLRLFPEVLLNNYKVWPAVQTVNFLFVPVHLRLILANCVALLWNTYMSWMAHQASH
uniref:Mitochondrial inner membrane protein Mpv17 n=1 Tax=Macrostomum lignano TaxID=282301 RepID=A0A1I8HJK6_9PLAT